MAQTIVDAPANVVERNIMLVSEIMRYLLDHPEVFSSLPDNFELVILPDDDPEMRMYNLELLDTYGSKDKPIVFARIKSRQEDLLMQATVLVEMIGSWEVLGEEGSKSIEEKPDVELPIRM